MSDTINFLTIITLIGCLLAGAACAWLLYRGSAHLEKRLRWLLAIARTLVIAVIAGLLFFPLVRSISYNLEKPVIVIGQDNSLSVGQIEPAGFNRAGYEKDFKALAAGLEEKYDVKVYHFSDSIGAGFDFNNKGKLSNVAGLISQLNDEMMNLNVGAVILASDGIFNRGGSPLYELNKLKAPVYTIALGDTIPKRDVMVANVNHNSLVYLDNEFTLEIQLQAFESKGEETTLSILDNGKNVYTGKQRITSDAFVQNISVKLKASRLGLQKYTVNLSPVNNEVSVKNNTQNIFVDVIDARQKVLIAASGPHPDIATLRQAITANEHYDLKVVVGEDLNVEKPTDYSLVILYQLPSAQNDVVTFLSRLKQSNVPIWYILGAQSNLSAFNQLQQGVSYNGSSNTLQEAFAYANPGFTAFNIDPASTKLLEQLDPLQSPLGKVSIAGTAVVALNQRIGKIKTESPQWFFTNEGGKKAGYLIGEGLWRWKLGEAEEAVSEASIVNGLIASTVQYLSVKDDKRKFKVYTAKNTFDENEHVLLNAVLYNDSYLPVNEPDVSVQIKNETGKTYTFLFSRTETAYQLDAGTLPAGSYSYRASTALGSSKYTAEGVFYVDALLAEYQQTIANHQLLHTMSAQTNGKLYLPAQLMEILNDIGNNEQIKTLSYEDRKYQELINFKWLFFMIMALLALEWFFRKRNGEI
jgi:hypothetical protein